MEPVKNKFSSVNLKWVEILGASNMIDFRLGKWPLIVSMRQRRKWTILPNLRYVIAKTLLNIYQIHLGGHSILSYWVAQNKEESESITEEARSCTG